MTISYLFVGLLEQGDMQKGGFQRMVRIVGFAPLQLTMCCRLVLCVNDHHLFKRVWATYKFN